MFTTKHNTLTAILVTTFTVTVSGLLAQQRLDLKPKSPVPGAATASKPAAESGMTPTEAKLARLRELIRPQPGEYATNIAKIAWERDPWQAAVKAGREGKPVLAYGVQSVGVTCGYG